MQQNPYLNLYAHAVEESAVAVENARINLRMQEAAHAAAVELARAAGLELRPMPHPQSPGDNE